MINLGNRYLGVAMVQRAAGDLSALAHDKIDEIYYILEGGGTLLTGGTLVNARETASSVTIGPGWSGTGIEGVGEPTGRRGRYSVHPRGHAPHVQPARWNHSLSDLSGRSDSGAGAEVTWG